MFSVCTHNICTRMVNRSDGRVARQNVFSVCTHNMYQDGQSLDRMCSLCVHITCTRMVNRSDGRVAQFFLAFMIHNNVPPEVDSFNIAIRAALVERDTGLREV